MRLARFLHVLVLLALLLAPAGMLGSHAAMAMPQDAAATGMGHCDERQAPSDEDRQRMLDCAMACSALPAMSPTIALKPLSLSPRPSAAPVPLFEGTTPEAVIPPPRFS